jgi:hypothetical protein
MDNRRFYGRKHELASHIVGRKRERVPVIRLLSSNLKILRSLDRKSPQYMDNTATHAIPIPTTIFH